MRRGSVRRGVMAVSILAGLGGAVLASALAQASPLPFSRPIPVRPRLGPLVIHSFGGVACPSRRLCIANDGTARIVMSTNPAGGRRAWTRAVPIGHGSISALGCASTSVCVAAGDDDLVSGIYMTTDPAGGAGTWFFEPSMVFDSVIEGVSCPSVSLCVAVDETGDILTSTDPAGGVGTWTLAVIQRRHGDLEGVSCPSVSLCVAAGLNGAIYTSTDPAGGAATWRRTRRRGFNGWFGVSCPTRRLCVAAGSGFAISTNPTRAGSWRYIPEPPNGDRIKGITGISCPSSHLCVGADLEGLAFVSTDPAGGAGAWRVVRVHGSGGPSEDVRVACSHSRSPVCAFVSTVGEWLVVGRAPRHRR